MIDVIVPSTKEKSPYLRQAILSAKSQGCDPNIILIYDWDGKGPSWARNEGIRYAENSAVAFLDHDDICMSNRLAEQAKAILDGADFCICGASFINAKGEPMFGRISCNDFSYAKHLVRSQVASASCLMFRRSVLQALGGFDESIYANGEYDLILRAAKRFKGVYISMDLVQVRKHEGNLSNDRKLLKEGEKQALMKVSHNELKEVLEDDIEIARVLIRCEDYVNAYVLLSGDWDNFKSQFFLGVIYFKDRDFLHAKRCFERALHFEPDLPEALNNLGVTIAAMGDPLDAEYYKQKALAKRPDYEDASASEPRFTENLLR